VSPPTALIAEDESVLRAELRERLRQLWPELQICAEAADGIEALRALNQFAPQVVFLDIQMPGLTGLEVARQVAGRAHVVFLTAHDEHAIEAFERGALDYLQKPYSTARLAAAIDRIRQHLSAAPPDLREVTGRLRGDSGQGTDYLKWITVQHGHEIRLVATDEICYLRADNKYTSLVTANKEFLLTSGLGQIKERLDPQTFWQIHRSVVVNVSAIRSVHRTFRGALEVSLKQRPEVLSVSAAHAHLFKHL
jgi:DNA-binding LytR/AlgR family response regulator